MLLLSAIGSHVMLLLLQRRQQYQSVVAFFVSVFMK
jgi:hypothetical protein